MGRLWVSWGRLGPSWAVLGASWGILERSCEHLGGILWHLGGSWRHLGHLGGILETSWRHLGTSWEHLAGILGHLGDILGPPCSLRAYKRNPPASRPDAIGYDPSPDLSPSLRSHNTTSSLPKGASRHPPASSGMQSGTTALRTSPQGIRFYKTNVQLAQGRFPSSGTTPLRTSPHL